MERETPTASPTAVGPDDRNPQPTAGVAALLRPTDLRRVKRSFVWMQLRQFGLIVIFFAAFIGYESISDLLAHAGHSKLWGLPLFAVGFVGADWLSRKNHACPACRHTLPSMRRIRECPVCKVPLR